MIAKVMKGRGFTGLARYLETGRDGTAPDRVEWTLARNIPTDDPYTASLLMRATAAQSVRTEKPVYHIALSFDPEDAVDRATMVQAADRLMSDLGLQEHQALIVAHGDTRHPHLHLMINRVHPETFRAWDPKNDYAQIERSLREQEHELALRAVPGHHYDMEGHERPDRSEALSTGQIHRWERTGEVPFDALVRQAAGRDLLEATSWKDLEARLNRKGLRLERRRDRGLVVTDGEEHVKISSVGSGISRPALEQRFEARYGEDQSQSRASGSGPWVSDYGEMARKTVTKRGIKYVAIGGTVARAVELDNDVSGIVPTGEEGASRLVAEHTRRRMSELKGRMDGPEDIEDGEFEEVPDAEPKSASHEPWPTAVGE